MFADDLFLFGCVDIDAAFAIKEILDVYSSWSGQLINFNKSSIYFSPKAEYNTCNSILAILGVKVMSVNDKYLGHTLLKPKSRVASYDDLLEKCRTRLQSWMSSYLSHAGRATMIQSTLGSLAIYFMSCYKLPKAITYKLLCFQRDFWWNHNENENKITFLAWSKICTPKDLGGLGFRDPETVNEALLAKLAWRFLIYPHSFWVQLLSARYLQRHNFWTVKKIANCSSIWTGILAGRDIIAPFVCWFIGNGLLVRIWEDPWVSSLPGFRVDGFEHNKYEISAVSELICPSSNSWHLDMLQTYFPTHEMAAILKIRSPVVASKDKLIWVKTKSGEFSTKSVYRCLCEALPSSSSTTSPAFNWKLFWKVRGISPRVHLFLWRLIQNAIALKSNIAKHLPDVDTICHFCYDKIETTDHLFLYCGITKQIWFASPIGLCIDASIKPYTIPELFNAWLTNRDADEVFKLGCALIWSIWKARNRVIFDQLPVRAEDVIRTAVHLYSEHNTTYSFSSSASSSNGLSPSIQHGTAAWIPPPYGMLKVNVDGAHSGNNIAAGIIIRDYRGSFIAGNCFFDGQWTGIDGALEAEARAFLKGLELARDLRFHTVTLEGDSQMIVSYLTDDRLKFPWRIRSVILDCREIMSSFNHIQIQHVTRKANQAAHQLAAYAFSSRSCFSWRGLAPSCITSTLLADMSTHVVS
ncbi:Reverse transcriptase zinc-binding domain [Macleaya cordata]|uniref:Reverse transcriptase zinc-binding domain n=1 Tax=Macleaya cordata TaxID=56857 RepID=A0A200Q061_MACCD|nr:Reverse transcriptase zinc-binding domain [Macleaya cordata]